MTSFRALIHEIHRRSLWQVLGVYAVASWVIYQVVLALWEGIGLPSWVPGTALVLLLIGLPVVLATAFVQEGAPGRGGPGEERLGARVSGLESTADALTRPAVAAGEGERWGHADAPPGLSRRRASGGLGSLLSWPRAITGGVLAFAALGLAASGFMGMRALGIGPAATLISSGALESGTRVLVADFESPPGDSLTAFALAEAVRIDLAQADALAVVDPAEVGPALARMQRAPGTRLTEDIALELAVREGIPVVVVGELTPVGPGYQITARLIRADSNRVLLHVRERAATPADVLPAMDRLTDRLLERTGESIKSIRAARPLAAFTTSSLEALRIYSQAERFAVREMDNARAEELLEAALRQDSTFAMAWRKLGAVRSNQGDRSGAVEAFTKAIALAERLPEMERLFAAAAYHFYVDYDLDRVIDAYERMIELDSTRWGAYNNLAIAYRQIGDFESAVDLYALAVAIDSAALPLGNYAWWALAIGDTARAREGLEAHRRLHPDNPSNPAIGRDLMYARGEVAEIGAEIERLLEHERRASVRQLALWDRALLEFRAGRIRAGTRTWEERRAERERAGLPTDAFLLNLAYLHLTATGDTVNARASLDRYVRDVLPDIPELDRPFLLVAGAYAMLGDLDAARAALADWEHVTPPGLRRRDEASHRVAEGMVALAEGRPDQAIAALQASTERTADAYLNRFFLARALDLLDRPDSALAAYHRWEHTRFPNRLFADASFLGPAYERMAALHDERGDRSEAAEYYRRFIELWRDADPELQPRVEAARRALARLTSEGSRAARPRGRR